MADSTSVTTDLATLTPDGWVVEVSSPFSGADLGVMVAITLAQQATPDAWMLSVEHRFDTFVTPDGKRWRSNATDSAAGTALVEVGAGGGGLTDGDKGDVVVSGDGAVWTLDPSVVGSLGSSLHSNGGLVGNLAPGGRVLVAAVPIGETLDIGSVLQTELRFVGKNPGTVGGSYTAETFFGPTSRGDLAYLFAGISRQVNIAHGHGVLLNDYVIKAPGRALVLTGTSGSNAGLQGYGLQTAAGFMSEVPASNIGSQSTAVPLWTEEPLTLYVVVTQTGAGAEDWISVESVTAIVKKSRSRGSLVAPSAQAAHAVTLPAVGPINGPSLAQLAAGGGAGGVGGAFAVEGAGVMAEANWSFTANPDVPLCVQPKWSFDSKASGVDVSVWNDPVMRTDSALLTVANFDTVVGSTITGSVSGQRAMTFTPAPSDAGKTALRDYVSRLDPVTQTAPRSERAMWARYGDGLCGPGDTVWMAVGLEFASSGSVLDTHADTVCQLWQIHPGAMAETSNSPGLALESWQGNLYITRYWTQDDTGLQGGFQAQKTLIATAPARNTRHLVVTKSSLMGGSGHAAGFTQVWVNGTLAATINGGVGYSPAMVPSHRAHSVHYLKTGIYYHEGAGTPASESATCHRVVEAFWRNPSAAVTEPAIRAALSVY